MTTTENKQMMQRIFDALAIGNSRPLLDAMAPDFRWVFPGDWSWSGVWEPKHEVITGLLQPLFARFADRYATRAEVVLADEDRVVVQAHGRVVTRSGASYNNTYCYIFRVRGALITEVIEHCDTALVERVLGPPPARTGPMVAKADR